MSQAQAGASARKKIEVRLTPEANLKTLTDVISTIGGRYGCRTCGLAGIDLELSGQPVEDEELSKVSGVRSAHIA